MFIFVVSFRMSSEKNKKSGKKGNGRLSFIENMGKSTYKWIGGQYTAVI